MMMMVTTTTTCKSSYTYLLIRCDIFIIPARKTFIGKYASLFSTLGDYCLFSAMWIRNKSSAHLIIL